MTRYRSTGPDRFLNKLGALLMSVVLAGALTAVSTSARAIEWGINGPPAKKMDVEPIFKMMKARGLTQYRVGVNLTKDTEGVEGPMLKHMVALAKTYGITLRPLFGFGFRWGDRTDAGNYPAGDRDALYQQGFNRTYAFVDQFKNDIDEWELENEINLVARDPDGKRMFGRGGTAEEYELPIMEDWAALLKGASDAIDKINKENGLHLRRTMNTTSTMFGFLDFMTEKGVGYDVISYHYYEVEGQNPHRNWNGKSPPFDLFKKLASYHKPIVFNEVNCGEIYNPNYGNKVGDPLTERCLHTLNTILTVLRDQKDANIKSVSIYNLLDEPVKKPPENRFGLMYDLNTPKVPFYLLTRFAGGHLSDAEAAELSKRGL